MNPKNTHFAFVVFIVVLLWILLGCGPAQPISKTPSGAGDVPGDGAAGQKVGQSVEEVAGYASGLGWHCFQNHASKNGNDAGCGRTLPECKKLIAVYRDVYRDEAMPFEPSDCFPVTVVEGFTYRDSDTRWWYFRAFLLRDRCDTAFKNLPDHDLPLTSCHSMVDPSLWPERQVTGPP